MGTSRSHTSTMCRHSLSGMRPRSRAFARPCVPDFDPRGADSWQGAPLRHGGQNRGSEAFVNMSVGFMALAPYWQ